MWKKVSGIKTHYHYSDEGLIGEYDADGNEIKTYGWKPNSTWGTDPLFMKIGSEYYFYHNDHLGTPQQMTGVNGAVVWAARYESFGRAVVEVDAVENNLRFPGQYFDGESGLHYNWHRYYDTGIGRYLRSDPIGLAGGVNFYVYVGGNPIGRIDPSGLCSMDCPDCKGGKWDVDVGLNASFVIFFGGSCDLPNYSRTFCRISHRMI